MCPEVQGGAFGPESRPGKCPIQSECLRPSPLPSLSRSWAPTFGTNLPPTSGLRFMQARLDRPDTLMEILPAAAFVLLDAAIACNNRTAAPIG